MLVVVLAALQAALAASVGLGDDEALYWTWAQDLGGVTVDHPPLVAWLVAGGTALLGDTPLGVRLPFLVLGVATSGVMGAWTRRATGDPRAAAVAMVAVAVAPLFAIGHVFAAPDMPVWLCTAVAGLAVDRALGGKRGRPWLLAGLAVGIGLWAKLTMALVPLSVLGFLFASREHRSLLRTRGPWLAAAAATLIWTPWLVWQADAGFPTLRFHLVERHGAAPGLGGLLGGIAGQLGYLSPVLAVGVLVGLVRPALRSARAWTLPLALAAPPLVLFTVAGAATRALPHWGGAGWLAALVPGALLLSARPRLAGVALGLAALLSAVVHVQAVRPILPLGVQDPTHDLHGWPVLADALRPLAAESDDKGCQPRLRGTRYQTASQASFAWGPGGPAIPALARPLARRPGPIEDPPSRCGAMLVVASDRYPLAEPACPAVVTVPVIRAGAPVRELRIHRCD